MYWTKMRLTGLYEIDLYKDGASPSDPFIFTGADGLGPNDVANSISNPLNQQSFLQGSQVQPRFPVIGVGLNPDWSSNITASDLRTKIYGLLTPPRNHVLKLQLMNNTVVVAETWGYVKRVEINPFTKDPQVQISMDCIPKYLESPTVLSIDTDDFDPLLFTIENAGNAPSGFEMKVAFTGSLSALELRYWPDTEETGPFMRLEAPFESGDVITIDTHPGSRKIVRNFAEGYTEPLIAALVRGSSWFELNGGTNRFFFSSPDIDFRTFTYTPKYWGI